MKHDVTILTSDPVVSCIADLRLNNKGLKEMLEWVKDRRPDCVPFDINDPLSMFPHGGAGLTADGNEERILTHNELLVELAGRKCYNSFGEKAGQKTNKGYIENTQIKYDIPHASIMYHAKMSFFIGGVSRRVSHELIRHYVGADRDEEGSPSQESTRYTEHTGHYIAHPWILNDDEEMTQFRYECRQNYDDYLSYISRQREKLDKVPSVLAGDKMQRTMKRKRILESASAILKHSVETSFIWTTNPIALAKMFRERDNEAADLEYLRFAKVWKKLCVERWPNLFPQPWMKESSA